MGRDDAIDACDNVLRHDVGVAILLTEPGRDMGNVLSPSVLFNTDKRCDVETAGTKLPCMP
jgi:hypothetical protein